MEKTIQLLKSVQSKIELYEKHKELSGENFNIFSIMGMESDEVFTHSAIIAELLNPKGSHGLGNRPLELFITQFIDEDFQFTCQNISCIKEQFIGEINADKTEGGRLDIVVKNSLGEIFVIENKIYAFEQQNQLLRYKNKYPHAKLFYLTLDGDTSRQIDNEENLNNDYYTKISYKETILEWLENCVPLAYNKPTVRETLNQYIYLIKKLTNQTTNEEMSEEIVKIIDENFESSIEIYNNFEKALQSRQDTFLEKIKEITELQREVNSTIKKLSIEKINDSKRLILFLSQSFFVSFHFKNKNQPLILIGNSSEEFIAHNLANDVKYNESFELFKKPNWKTDNYIFWKHEYNNLGLAKNLVEAEKSNKQQEIALDLLKIASQFHKQFLS